MVQVPSKPVPDLPVHPFGPQVTGGIPLCCAWGLQAPTASSGMQVLREAHSIKSHISHSLLSVSEMLLLPNWQSPEIPVMGCAGR